MNAVVQEMNSIVEDVQSMDTLEQKMDSSQSVAAEIRSYPTLERIFTESPRRIILQGVSSDELIKMISIRFGPFF